jgi:hypothetical protein
MPLDFYFINIVDMEILMVVCGKNLALIIAALTKIRVWRRKLRTSILKL